MTTPDPSNLAVGRAIPNPANDPAADALGATYPSSVSPPISEPKPRAVPGLTIGFTATPTRSTIVKLPFMELPLVGFVLATIAGIMNAFSLDFAAVFATVQSGNVVLLALGLASWQWDAMMWPLFSIIAFGLGAFVSGAVVSSVGRRGGLWTTWALVVLGLVTAGLALLVLAGPTTFPWVAVGLAFVAGAMGSAYHKEHNMLFGALAVTFLVQMTFHFLARSVFGRKDFRDVPNIRWAGVFLSVLMGFFIGVAGAGAVVVLLGHAGVEAAAAGTSVLMIAAILFWILAAFSKRTADEGEPVESTGS